MPALTTTDLKAHAIVLIDEDDAVLTRVLAAATSHVERLLGYRLDNTEVLPGGAPADLQLAVLQLAAHWLENREATLVGVAAQPIPFGIDDIIREHRNYTYG